MIILPAIDIQNGECVRLYQGDFSTAHKVSDSPQETAAQFRKAGAEWVHMVDLDGAKEARAKNTALFWRLQNIPALRSSWAAASGRWKRWKPIWKAVSHV